MSSISWVSGVGWVSWVSRSSWKSELSWTILASRVSWVVLCLTVGAPQMTAVSQNKKSGPEVTSPRY
jgi:hypothetical protein